MLSLYPNIQPYKHFWLTVSHGHKIYVEEVGNPYGIPVLCIHGGPGSGISTNSRRLFDPEFYRIILFDQRGCGQSTPSLDLAHNTTIDLINDIEALRQELNIDTWVLYGGSWGSTLALLYAQQYPQHVKFLILRGIFLARRQDLLWLFGQDGAARIYPEHYAQFMQDLPNNNMDELIKYYLDKFLSTDELEKIKYAKRWATWETKCSTLEPCSEKEKFLSVVHEFLSFALIEAHYFLNNCFIAENQILNNMHNLRDLSAVIVHGRQDMVCPMDNAYALAQAWPEQKAELQIISPAGHALAEPLIASALVSVTNKLKLSLA